MPNAPEVAEPAPTSPLFDIGMFGAEGYFEVRVVATTPGATAAMQEAMRAGQELYLTHLRDAEKQFFQVGFGAGLVERNERIRTAETAVADARNELVELRKGMPALLATDDDAAIIDLEKKIEAAERKVSRLVGRVELLRPERDQFREQCRPKLRDALLVARDEYRAEWERRKNEAHAVLAAAVNATFLERLRAGANHEWSATGIDQILKSSFPNT